MSINLLNNFFNNFQEKVINLPLGALSGSALAVAPSLVSKALEHNPQINDPLYPKIEPRVERLLGSTFLGSLGYTLLGGAKLLGTINGILFANKIIAKEQRSEPSKPASKIYMTAQLAAMAINLVGTFLTKREKMHLYSDQKKKYLIQRTKERKALSQKMSHHKKRYEKEKAARQELLKNMIAAEEHKHDGITSLHKMPLYTIPEE